MPMAYPSSHVYDSIISTWDIYCYTCQALRVGFGLLQGRLSPARCQKRLGRPVQELRAKDDGSIETMPRSDARWGRMWQRLSR